MSAHPDDPEGLSLQDLADETGLEPRTIRSYVEKGLLPGPDSLGRGARYPREALDRLRVLVRLRDADRGLSLEQIRVLLQGLSPARLHAIAAGRSSLDALWAAEPVASIAKGAALEYLRGLSAGRASRPSRHAAPRLLPPPPPARDPGLSALEESARALAALAGTGGSRGARGEHWVRIPVTPDVELTVRGTCGADQLVQFHRIADALRSLLTKGAHG